MNTANNRTNSSSLVYAVTLYDGEREHIELYRTEEKGQAAFEVAVGELEAIAQRELGEHVHELERSIPIPNYYFAGISIYWATLTQKKVHG